MDDLFAMRFQSFGVKLPRTGNDARDFRCMAREFRGIRPRNSYDSPANA
jgi:hypothetical protein